MNRLLALKHQGQSIWIDYIKRSLMTSGELKTLIEQDGVCGLTSNPAIFEKAIGGSSEYDADLRKAIAASDADPSALFEEVAIQDIRLAADALRSVYDETHGVDGYVSLEVNPYLAFDTANTVADARRLWRAVDRPNLMIKVPGTAQGAVAIRELIADGINVNVTLLFSRDQSRAVAAAYINGIVAYAKSHGDASHVASVASFFVSRIDNEMDAAILARLQQATDQEEKRALEALPGKVAIANARLAYADWQEMFGANEQWQELATKFGARPQRLLWASTGTKNPKYRDTLYIDELVLPHTVNTVPPATLDAYRDHGELSQLSPMTLSDSLAGARATLAEVERLKLPLKQVTDKLLADGIVLFEDADDKLKAAVARKRNEILGPRLARQTVALASTLKDDVTAALRGWNSKGLSRRLWAKDSSLWTGADEAQWLDWLNAVTRGVEALPALKAFGAGLRAEGFSSILLIGMGGSSLGPEVVAKILGNDSGMLPLHVIDSTDPAQIASCEAALDIAHTLFIVASKSGSTLEPDVLLQYFLTKAKAELGTAVGRNFVAITDPGSKLEAFARENEFRNIFAGVPTIGGRYSVLSNFGLVPAAAMGVDIELVLSNAALMMHSCSAGTPAEENPGVILGTIMGTAARSGRDKLTILSSPTLASFGAWVEQLVAESTGKHGVGIVPVNAEPAGAPAFYDNDRLFVYLGLDSDAGTSDDQVIAALVAAGHPVVHISLANRVQIAQEFFRWEIATAVAGAVLNIHPFDQPDVEAAKIQTRELMKTYERDNILPQDAPALLERNITVYSGETASDIATVQDYLAGLLGRIRPGDYFALLAYLEMSDACQSALQAMRMTIRDQLKVATCLEFGPRFLHSTGQLYKGGANNGVFLQITCDDLVDLAIPGRNYSFGTVKAAQALGDISVLRQRGRRTLHLHLNDLNKGLLQLRDALAAALAQLKSN